MEIKAAYFELDKLSTRGVVFPIFESEALNDRRLSIIKTLFKVSLERMIEEREIKGKWKEITLIHVDSNPVTHLFLIGLGKKNDFKLDRLRSFAALAIRAARNLRLSSLTIVPPEPYTIADDSKIAQTLTEGAILGLYKFSKYKSKLPDDDTLFNENPIKELFLFAPDILKNNSNTISSMKEGIKRGTVIAEAVNLVRDLVNEPSNKMTPAYFVEQASSSLSELPIEIAVVSEKEAQDMGMGAFISVAKGSDEPAKIIVLRYNGTSSNSFTLGLVGKGVTFDSGGISLKPSEQMHTMTSDMAGAAAVVGAFRAITTLKLPVNLLGVIPLTENLPSGKATKPGDIVKAYNGKTIEILNTDAEGRLILADALAYAVEQGAQKIVDLATLTGACVIALGHAVSGLFGTSKEFMDMIVKAGEETHEKVWPMPLLDEYTQAIKGTLADLKNTGGKPGGSCTAAAFLKEFVGDVPWAHIDIAGTALLEGDKSLYPSYFPENGASGIGVRLLVELVLQLAQKSQV